MLPSNYICFIPEPIRPDKGAPLNLSPKQTPNKQKIRRQISNLKIRELIVRKTWTLHLVLFRRANINHTKKYISNYNELASIIKWDKVWKKNNNKIDSIDSMWHFLVWHIQFVSYTLCVYTRTAFIKYTTNSVPLPKTNVCVQNLYLFFYSDWLEYCRSFHYIQSTPYAIRFCIQHTHIIR